MIIKLWLFALFLICKSNNGLGGRLLGYPKAKYPTDETIFFFSTTFVSHCNIDSSIIWQMSIIWTFTRSVFTLAIRAAVVMPPVQPTNIYLGH